MAKGKGTVIIAENGQPASKRAARQLRQKFEAAGYMTAGSLDRGAELIVCIGGDGALLGLLAEYDFPGLPIAGINTGHLGFFQDVSSRKLDEFVFNYSRGNYRKQIYRTVYADIRGAGGDGAAERLKGLNEIVIRGGKSHSTHLNIFIGDSFIEQFCGDGVVVSTPAGSTAYNYSLGGSIVDPRLELLQLTPIAPINSTAYRSFTSGILLPPDKTIGIFPEYPKSDEILVTADGVEHEYLGPESISLGFGKETVTILRFREYDFWDTVKQKLL
ncbi:MAG: NAD(+)/NADH kinase [Clostridiales Family XIII bacterium]|jgi:NAD+ kinase|nr:NAD(+)/NADH kinase [Clostridiales Family XIII bacterium]